jgi:hypothetical protein
MFTGSEFSQTTAVLLAASERSRGIFFLAVVWIVAVGWWIMQRRRQSWWWGYSRRPGDNTGERWIQVNEARADKPMPERRVNVARQRRR